MLTVAFDGTDYAGWQIQPNKETIEGVDDGKVFVSEATDIQAGVPYLVKNVSKAC